MWYEILVADEFISYFSNDNNIFFTKESEEEILAPTFLRFRNIVGGVTRAFYHQEDAASYAEIFEDLKEYDVLEGFNFCIKHISSLNLSKYHLTDIWHSIRGPRGEYTKYNIPTEKLSAEQCAVLIMYQFWSRMGIRGYPDFQKSGELKRYLLALKNKVEKEKAISLTKINPSSI